MCLERELSYSSPETILDQIDAAHQARAQRLAAEVEARRVAEEDAQRQELAQLRRELDRKASRQQALLRVIDQHVADLCPLLAELSALDHEGSALQREIWQRQMELHEPPSGGGWSSGDWFQATMIRLQKARGKR